MSAVNVVPFPVNARAVSARRRAVKESVDARAKETCAPLEQRRKALAAALAELDRGGSAGWAIQLGYNELPSLRRPAYRVPTSPDAA